jgi:hypothetical protein
LVVRTTTFGQAAPVTLGPLPPVEFADYLEMRFSEGERDLGDALGPLFDVADGHPQRAMLLAHRLYERLGRGDIADLETWTDALQAARVEAQNEIAVQWESCTALERKVLKVIAERSVALASREADRRYGLAKGRSAQAAAGRLLANGHLVPDDSTRTGRRVVDPFFAAWLREG